MTPIPLRDLLLSLGRALRAAQQESDEQHLRQVDRYLHDDGTPVMRRIRFRDPSPGAPGRWQDAEVPLLALVPRSSIRFRRLVLDLDVDDVDLGRDEVSGSGPSTVVDGATATVAHLRVDTPPPGGPARRLRIVTECSGDLVPPLEPDDPVEPPAGVPVEFTVSTRLVGEEEIDVDDEATLVVRVAATAGPDPRWTVDAATLLLDVDGLPSTITVLAGETTWRGGMLALDLGAMRPGTVREVGLRLATGRFAGAATARPGSYSMRARVEAACRWSEARQVVQQVDPIVIDIAPD